MSKSVLVKIASVISILGCISCTQINGDFPKNPAMFNGRVINHTNYDPGALSNWEITQASALKMYFQHASVGGNICEGLDDLAGEYGSRYVMERTGDGEVDASWFDTHTGLADYHRGNPDAAVKVENFTNSLDGKPLITKLDVATFKFCWIDSPPDAQVLFDITKAAVEALETKYPQVVFVWWTMPLETLGGGNTQRQNYNDLVRTYCGNSNRWLLDVADLESHDEAGTLNKDSSSREVLVPSYAVNTEGDNHLNALGRRKMALAYWKLMAEVAKTR